MHTTRHRTDHPSRTGFTLTELVVAIGLVALLTIGIGRLFSTVTRLTGTGTAIAETDALARVLETRLRQDFEGLNRLPEDQVFVVISNRAIGGDLNFSDNRTLQNPDASEGERELYFTRDDQLADQRRAAIAYSQNSLATTRRLDSIVFPAQGGPGGNFTSFQQDPLGRNDVSATHALIVYGHALRPLLDPGYDPTVIDPTDRASFARRQFFADDGTATGTGAFGTAFGAPNSRNEFAANWMLARQQLLLYGGLAAGYPAGSNRAAPIGNDREFIPYVRDFEADTYRFAQRRFGIDPEDPRGGLDETDFPNPRARYMGRSDIIAMDLDDMVRWLSGQEDLPIFENLAGGNVVYLNRNYPEFIGNPEDPRNYVPLDATPYSTGSLDLARRLHFFDGGRPIADAPLWRRRFGYNGTLTRGPEVLPRIDAYYRNVANLQSALVGTLGRTLIEPEPFPARRADPDGVSDPVEARMDVASLLAERCSSFEVAWSDGSTWQFDEPLRIDSDGIYDETDENTVDRVLRRGDVIWFDMNFTRQDLWNAIAGNVRDDDDPPGPEPYVVPNSTFSDTEPEFQFRTIELARQFYPQPEPGVEIGDRNGAPSTLPLYYTDAMDERQELNGFMSGTAAGRENRLFGFRTLIDNSFSDLNNEFAEYSAQLTGGALPDQGDEYFAVFGFRDPNGTRTPLDGDDSMEATYTDVTRKPTFIRIRCTLHDRQFRIPGGRDYEFVFEIDPIEAE